MVFFYVAGPMGVFGTGLNGGIRQHDQASASRVAMMSIGLLVLNALVNAYSAWSAPLLLLGFVQMSFFGSQNESFRVWARENWVVVIGMLFMAYALFVQEDEYSPPPSGYRRYSDPTRMGARASPRRGAGREFGEAERSRSRDIEIEGSWSGNVFFDFGISILFLLVPLLFHRIWMYINRFVLSSLSEQQRQRWHRWTEFLRPAAQAPGSVPTAKSALEKLEDIILEERHLLMENSPSGIVCPVCLENMKIGDRVKKLPCKHLFHPECVLPWLEKHNSCPSCRYELETNDPDYEMERIARQRRQETQESQRRERQQEQEQERQAREREQSGSATNPGAGDRQHGVFQRVWQSIVSLGNSREIPSPLQQTGTARPVPPVFASSGMPQSPTGEETLNQFTQAMSREAEVQRLLNLSVVELKAIARRRNVNIAGCVEKRDLVERIVRGGFQ